MAKRQRYRQPSTPALLFQIWVEAADMWRQLRSDPRYAACVKARAAWYLAVYGEVPPIISSAPER
jgi:hypothetical protein